MTTHQHQPDQQMHTKSLVVFAATSAIAQAVAQQHAQQGYTIVLVGRNAEKLKHIQAHLSMLGAPHIAIYVQDLNEFSQHDALIEQILTSITRFDRVLFAQGTLPNQAEMEKEYTLAEQCIKDNALSTISLCTLIANTMQNHRVGIIGIISSVAGDRGRQSNYIYGASKALLTTFAAGLRHRLSATNVHVMTIKPGFVDTPMTADIAKTALWATPEQVAYDITKGFNKKTNCLYTPHFWRYIMFIIRSIPEGIFKRMKL